VHEPLAVALAHEWPAYAAFATSFLIIGSIWVNHHAVFELVGRVDCSVLFLDLLLMSVVARAAGTAAAWGCAAAFLSPSSASPASSSRFRAVSRGTDRRQKAAAEIGWVGWPGTRGTGGFW
jgi:hypothetical protein